MQSIAHDALIRGEEIREYMEERVMRGELRSNPAHPPAKQMRTDIPEVVTIVRSLMKTRDDLNKLIRKYTKR